MRPQPLLLIQKRWNSSFVIQERNKARGIGFPSGLKGGEWSNKAIEEISGGIVPKISSRRWECYEK